MTTPTQPPPASFRTAVIVRAHAPSEKLSDLLRLLSGSYWFDLYVAVDESAGYVPIEGAAKLSHTRALCAGFGLCAEHAHALWQCGDYALYFAHALIPNYALYVMIEYDVDFTSGSKRFLERIVSILADPSGEPRHDLVVPQFDPANPLWGWTDAASEMFPNVYNTGTFAFVAVSRRALLHLLELRRVEASRHPPAHRLIHCEAFCGSALSAAGFSCASLPDLIPGSVAFSSFHPPAYDLTPSFYPLGYHQPTDPAIEMIHPVYDFPTFCAAQRKRDERLGEPGRLAAIVDAIAPRNERDAALIRAIREQAATDARPA